jgi:hypothetical protein
MKHKNSRFYSVLALVLVLVAVPPAVAQAGGEDDEYSAAVYTSGRFWDGTAYSFCYVTIYYSNYGASPFLNVYQVGWGGPAACPDVVLNLTGDDVPEDIVLLKGPVGKWFADGYFDLALDGLAWNFDVTTNRIYEGGGKFTYYPSGSVSASVNMRNEFDVNSFEVNGIIYDAYSGVGLVTKYE